MFYRCTKQDCKLVQYEVGCLIYGNSLEDISKQKACEEDAELIQKSLIEVK